MLEKWIYITIDFMPPSVNEAYWWYRVRHKTDKYKDFLKRLELFFLQLDKTYSISWDSWLYVDYFFKFPLYFKNWKIRKKDLANYEKVLTDWLSHFIEWFNDEKIRIMKLEKYDSDKEGVVIKIEELDK